MDNVIQNLKGLMIALLGGVFANLIHVPLPWLLGAVFASALWKINGYQLKCDNRLRQAGQWVIGTSLGLHFTPQILSLLSNFYLGILLGVVFALSLGAMGAFVLCRFLKLDLATAWFASMVGGASEMATMAETYQGKIDFVASAHTIRLLLIVTLIPFSFYFLDLQGEYYSDVTVATNFSWWGLLVLVIAGSGLAMLFQKIHLPVAWVLAPLIITATLTIQDIHLASLPVLIKHIGQVLIGLSLGNKFSVGFFSRSPKFLMTVAGFNVIGLLLTLSMAYVLHLFMPIDMPTLVLSLSAGGIAEMAITAETLHFGVAIVTVFHVIRMASVVILTQPLFILIKKLSRGYKP